MKIFSPKIVLLVLFAMTTAGVAQVRPFHLVDFDHYWTEEEIDFFLHDLVEDNPDLVRIEDFGDTVEGRHLDAVIVQKGATPKPAIVIEAGVRPREWLGPMTALYFIHELVEHSENYAAILDKVDFIFLPLANPDGYVYSQTTNVNWKKNRRQTSLICYGVDLGTNFQYHFTTNNLPCSDYYSGASYFSEVESQAIRDVLEMYQSQVKMYLSLQVGGPEILYPYNYLELVAPNSDQLITLANQVAAVIYAQPSKRTYKVGSGGMTRGLTTGTSLDYAFVSKNIHLSYDFMLPSGGENTWNVPETQISEIVSETFQGFLVFADYVGKL